MVNIRRTVRIMTQELRGRVRGMIRRATLGSLKAGLGQSMQIGTTKDDTDDAVEYFEPYGFTSGPPAGSEGIALRVGGERANTVVICMGNRTVRLQGVNQNEVAMYTKDGASVILRNSGNIEVTPGAAGVVQLGGPGATLAVARATDPVSPANAMTAWALVVETAINALAAGTFSPANSFAGTVQADFASIASGGNGSTST